MNTSPHTSKISLTFDWRIICGLLFVIIGVMLYFWQPWHNTSATKTITIHGEATVQHEPDQFTFNVSYEDADSNQLNAKGNAVVAKLKDLGVKSADIKTSASATSGNKELLIYPSRPVPGSNATYNVTAVVTTKDLAQKVEDYLNTTDPTGEVTPQTGFSKATAAKLDLDARREASADAKAKATVMAGQFGAKLGKVTKISEDNGYAYPLAYGTAGAANDSVKSVAPTLQPGSDEVTYSFTVVFELR
jgi:uncharacterized protein YggE